MKKKSDMDAAVAEDPLLRGLIEALGRKVEILAFGVSYIGKLESVDIDNGLAVIVDDEDRAMIELERITSLSLISS
ncbi:MAG: hypothetical protein A3C46_03535 [Deltaproteobacteria bacterium RIFCSPHIGHO2_02_FULL_44_16]|nr:MAG: hypothetical protein A3C46_03535 [Deltaproteobacteria bacterium RIFCSPHIGHO2_02_FULL_44_16]